MADIPLQLPRGITVRTTDNRPRETITVSMDQWLAILAAARARDMTPLAYLRWRITDLEEKS